ncbi:MAG: hypothetical protein GY727_03985 [Gammaproteobacteria bacterium]|nr:hypothetical protein [Gammaproteobacteria bacterium]MCP4091466.1 hypothetical protein [Gammaproteobacteria bacterium]MCP4275376.1 hypothetical protein [Gammaproteobacteria bacterium]MCP4832206.1 hypothetical protein [Gammaproteobacteria bacterium]MCP4928160.1 hypothetical protein [Gammaproteobacteria bacterium]
MARLMTGLFLLFTGSAAVFASSGAAQDDSLYLVMLYMHQILFVFWLGPDIGIYMWSTKATNPELTPAQRVAAGRIMRGIDIIPKVCMSLMLSVGGILTELMGIEHPWWQMIGIVLLGPVWLTLTLLVHFRAGTDAGAKLARIDIWFRWLVVLSVIGSIGLSMTTGRLTEFPWVTGKLMLFAAVVFFSIIMRTRLQNFIAGIDQLDATGGTTPELDRQLKQSMSGARTFMFATWLGLALAAGLGMAQPDSTRIDTVPAELPTN